MNFERNIIYSFPAKVFKGDNDILYYRVTYGVGSFSLPLYLCEKSSPECSISCFYEGEISGKPFFKRDLLPILKKFYRIDEIRRFRITLKEQKNNGFIEYELKDSYSIKHTYLGPAIKSNSESIVYLQIIGFDEKNRCLILTKPTIDNNDFISTDRFLYELNLSRDEEQKVKQDLFFTQQINNPNYLEFKRRYESGSSRWLFSYLRYLEEDIISDLISSKNIKELVCVSNICCVIEQWVLDNATTVSNSLGEEKYSRIIAKAYKKLEDTKALFEACQILLNNGVQEQLKQTDSLLASHPFSISKSRINSFGWLLVLDPNMVSSYWSIIARCLKCISKYLPYFDDSMRYLLANRLEKYVRLNEENLNEEDTPSRLLIILLEILILQEAKKCNILRLRYLRSCFFRLSSDGLVKEERAHCLHKCLSFLAGMVYPQRIFSWDNTINFDPALFLKQIYEVEISIRNRFNEYWYQTDDTGSLLILSPYGFHIFPEKLTRPFVSTDNRTILLSNKIFERKELVTSFNSSVPLLNIQFKDFLSTFEQWYIWTNKSYFNQRKVDYPKVGDLVLVSVDHFSKHNKTILVNNADVRYPEMKGISHVVSSKLKDRVNKGDTLVVQIVKIDPISNFFCFKFLLKDTSQLVDYYEDVVVRQSDINSRKLPEYFVSEYSRILCLLWKEESQFENKYVLSLFALESAKIANKEMAYYIQYLQQFYIYCCNILMDKQNEIIPEIISIPQKVLAQFPQLIKYNEFVQKCMTSTANKPQLINLYQQLGDSDNNLKKDLKMLLDYCQIKENADTSKKDNDLKNRTFKTQQTAATGAQKRPVTETQKHNQIAKQKNISQTINQVLECRSLFISKSGKMVIGENGQLPYPSYRLLINYPKNGSPKIILVFADGTLIKFDYNQICNFVKEKKHITYSSNDVIQAFTLDIDKKSAIILIKKTDDNKYLKVIPVNSIPKFHKLEKKDYYVDVSPSRKIKYECYICHNYNEYFKDNDLFKLLPLNSLSKSVMNLLKNLGFKDDWY